MSSATVRRVRVSIRSRHSMSGCTAETSRSNRIGLPDTLCTSRGPVDDLARIGVAGSRQRRSSSSMCPSGSRVNSS